MECFTASHLTVFGIFTSTLGILVGVIIGLGWVDYLNWREKRDDKKNSDKYRGIIRAIYDSGDATDAKRDLGDWRTEL